MAQAIPSERAGRKWSARSASLHDRVIHALPALRPGRSRSKCCIDADQLALARRMFMLSRTPWRDILLAPRGGLGAKKIPRDRIRKGVPRTVTEDVSYFYALHYLGKKRFVGYRVGQIFFIMWVDHDFRVYDHGS